MIPNEPSEEIYIELTYLKGVLPGVRGGEISLQRLAELTGLSRAAAQSALDGLQKKKLISVQRSKGA